AGSGLNVSMVGTDKVLTATKSAAGVGVLTATSSPAFTIVSSDTQAPTSPSIAINGGAAGTNFFKVNLTLAATESVSLPMQMCIVEKSAAGADCSGCSYEAYATSKVFTLTAVGTRYVNVKYKDAAA